MTGRDVPYRGGVPYEGDAARLPAAQVFRRSAPPRQAPWERRANEPPREMRSYPAPPAPDGGPAPDNSVTQLIPRFRDEDYPPAATPPQQASAPEEPPGKPPARPQKSLLASTGSIAIATLVSRITGFFKQIVM
ncbi:MAG: hypothetical protein WBB62_02275, partial [Rhodococcus sp. (in: high G+C Gram-positive bacteria)]